jgi:hypothetical protein
MAHYFNEEGLCPRCGTRRHYVSDVGKYIYTYTFGAQSFVEPKCSDEKEKRTDHSLIWEVLIFLLVCVCMYFLASAVQERRDQRRIEEYHSHITPATANDTL